MPCVCATMCMSHVCGCHVCRCRMYECHMCVAAFTSQKRVSDHLELV